MILEKETYKKFGYWPKDLKTKSGRPICWKCLKCSNVKVSYRYVLEKNKSGICRKCKLISRNEKGRIDWSSILPAKEDLRLVCDLLFTGSVIYTTSRKVPRIQMTCIALPIGRSIAILKWLDLDLHQTNTKKFKKRCLEFILQLPLEKRFFIMNYILTKHRTPITVTERVTISDTKEYIAPIITSLGMSYDKLRHKTISVKEGSFFIDERWVHVG